MSEPVAPDPATKLENGAPQHPGGFTLPDRAALMVLLDVEGRVIHFNRECERMTGFGAGEIFGRVFWDTLVPDGSRERIAADFAAVVEHGLPLVRRMAWITRTGTLRDVLMRIVRVGDTPDDSPDLLAIGIEVTGWSNEAPSEAGWVERLAKAFAASPTSIVISKLDDGMFVEINDAFCRLHGYSREEVIGRTSIDLGIWADVERRNELVRALRAGEEVRNVPVAVRHRDGRLHHCLCTAEIIELQGVPHVFSALHDVTERTVSEEQVRRMERLETVSQLASGIASDFNNALTVIQGNAALLLARDNLPAEVAAPLRDILNSSATAAALTRQLLLFGRRHAIQRTRTSLETLIRQTDAAMKRAAGAAIEFRFVFAPGVPQVSIDRDLAEQMLCNLVVQARDAMPGGGRIAIETMSKHFDGEEIQPRPHARIGDFSGLRFRDNGPGLAAGSLNRIFDPFFSEKDAGRSPGLGLAVVHGIVEQHGGWIDVDSPPDGGVVFTIWLPSVVEMPRAVSEPPSGPAGGGEGPVVLVVEERDAVRNIVAIGLRRCGCRPLTAADGDEALALWEQHLGQIELLFTDIVLPGALGGRELSRRLRERRPDLKVIFTSGFGLGLLNREMLDDPGSRFVPKPFGFDQLRLAVHELLPALATRDDTPND